MTKNEIANKINATLNLCRVITSSDDRLFAEGDSYDNRGNAESWMGPETKGFESENDYGYEYALYVKNCPCHVVDYDNAEEAEVLDAYEEEGECLVPAETKMIVTYVSSDEDYEEMGYYVVELEIA